MVDTLTRSEVLAAIKGLLDLDCRPDVNPGIFSTATDRIAALALVLPHLPADPAVPAPVAEPAPAQDPACPYPPVLTRWGLATWRKDGGSMFLYAPGAESFIAATDMDRTVFVYGGRPGFGERRNLGRIYGDPMPAILAALRELGSLPDEVPHG